MNDSKRWIDLDGAANVRDLGGLATEDGGVTRFGQVLRSDNLQDLSPGDVKRLVGELKLRDVVDLRSYAEVNLEGPGPLTRVSDVTVHHLTLFAEGGHHTDVEADLVLPWFNREIPEWSPDRPIGFYLGYLRDRPDSIVAALRVLAQAEGAVVVHCAAGKDRTGVVVALALSVAGVSREAIVEDYVQTGERLDAVLARLMASTTYAEDLDSRPADSHLPRSRTMRGFLEALDQRYGGPLGWLAEHGWTVADSAAVRTRLR